MRYGIVTAIADDTRRRTRSTADSSIAPGQHRRAAPARRETTDTGFQVLEVSPLLSGATSPSHEHRSMTANVLLPGERTAFSSRLHD